MGKLWISDTNGCWLDLWDKPRFSGNTLRLTGPADLPYLRVGNEHWSPQVRSVLVGPNAYVQLYEELNFHDSVIWLLPSQRIEDVAELPSNEDLDSMRIYDRPPFAQEPGYSAYMLWAASWMAQVADGR